MACLEGLAMQGGGEARGIFMADPVVRQDTGAGGGGGRNARERA